MDRLEHGHLAEQVRPVARPATTVPAGVGRPAGRAAEHGVDLHRADVEPLEIRYPVEQYPAKIVSFNLDKNPIAEGTLLGIKGQYLIFDTGVINIRKYTAYQLAVHQ